MTTASTLDRTQDQGQADRGSNESRAAAIGEINVGSNERWISGGVGALLALNALTRPRIRTLLLGGVGVMLLQRAVTGHCAIYEKLGMSTADEEGASPEEFFERGIHLEESFSILKPASELYNFWYDFENLPKFMKHLVSVEKLDDKRSRWVAKGPAGINVVWDAEVINDEPNRLIAWKSLGGAEVDTAGSVTFRERGDRGTEVSVVMDYIPPAGRVGSLIAKLFGRDADQMIREDLRNFKRLMETGEIPTIEGQPRGNCRGGGMRDVPQFTEE